jgi:beta-N-acetylhexosaminidase
MRVIREEIGFDGCLMTDDIGMEALSGTMAERAAASLAAGVDLVLHCKGDRPGMEATVSACHPLAGPALDRATRALSHRRPPEPADLDALVHELATLVPEEA